MKNNFNYNIISNSRLFENIENDEREPLLQCLSPRHAHYQKGEYIFQMGDKISDFGLVLQGRVRIIRDDYWGNRSLIGDIYPGELLGESFSCSHGTTLTVSAVAEEDSEILHMDVERIISSCPNSCAFHSRLIRNLVSILAEKNFHLTSKITHMSQRRLREKILSYLSEQSTQRGHIVTGIQPNKVSPKEKSAKKDEIEEKVVFDIPFNRQELADYLSIDRSALSAELSKLQEEGILRYRRNHFILLKGKK